jgi:hypothetical protein
MQKAGQKQLARGCTQQRQQVQVYRGLGIERSHVELGRDHAGSGDGRNQASHHKAYQRPLAQRRIANVLLPTTTSAPVNWTDCRVPLVEWWTEW